MSHFSAMVVGDIDHNLAPFHEFECTGNDDEFIETIDETEEARGEYESYKDDPSYPNFTAFVEQYYGRQKVKFGEEPDLEDDHKYGYFTVDEAGEVVGVFNRTNPDRKWDYYTVGGRWSGFLLGKDGNQHNSLKKSEIDIDGMRDQAGKHAADEYDEAMAGVEGVWKSFKEICQEVSNDYEKAREQYHSQPQIVKIAENLGREGLFFNKDAFLAGRDAYIQASRDRAISTLAIVHERNWVERGSMGWFGVVSDETDIDAWNERTAKFIDELPDDSLITIVDCHI